MTTVTEVSYSVDAQEAAQQSLADLIDDGSSNGFIRIRSSDDTLLAEIPLDDPCGTVSSETGQLTLDIDGTDSDPTAGVAEYGEVCDSDGNVHITLPVQEGAEAVSGYLVMESVTLLDGSEVSVTSAIVG